MLRPKPAFQLPFRQIHLDFHTGPAVPDVGRDFDAREFARTMKRASVSSVTVFAKCHHGHLYYDTKRPERHPGLKRGLDLTGQQVEALHREGIRAPIYISVQCDEYAADHYPHWIARNEDSSIVGRRGDTWFAAGWQILDMSSPYQEFLAEQTAEVLKKYRPVDGIFFDMCWDQPSTSQFAIAGILKMGLDPAKAADRQTYAHAVSLRYLDRFYKMVKAAAPDATVYFNGRSYFNLAEEVKYQSQVEIESLPTGGWGYMFFPRAVRFARHFDKPYMGMTARFHKSWADFGGLKPYAALEYETSQMMAHGAKCSIGDQLHPRGTLDAAAYDLIGKVYARVAEREPWLVDTRAVTQVGLFQAPTENVRTIETGRVDEGATRMLTQLRCQFDVVRPESPWEKYEALVLPDGIPVDAKMAARLKAYLKKGGKLLATGTSAMNAEGTKLALPELGVKPQGLSPYTVTYIRFGQEIAAGVPPTDHVMYDQGVRVLAAVGTQVLARIVEPYFERAWNHFSSHNQTPGDKVTPYAAATLKGGAACIPLPIFGAFARHGNYPYRLLVGKLLDLLLPEPILKVDGLTGMETGVMRQGRRTIVHLLYYAAERRAQNLDIIEDIVPIANVAVALKLAKSPREVYLAPARQPLAFEYSDGYARVTVPEVAGHAMVVFE
jgi:hypothetical protein